MEGLSIQTWAARSWSCLCRRTLLALPVLHVHIYLHKRGEKHSEVSGWCQTVSAESHPPLSCRGAAGISQAAGSSKLRSSVLCCWVGFLFGFFLQGVGCVL